VIIRSKAQEFTAVPDDPPSRESAPSGDDINRAFVGVIRVAIGPDAESEVVGETRTAPPPNPQDKRPGNVFTADVVDDTPPLPERISRYRIERVLGQGGFGRVYLAHDEQLMRRVAIKVPHARRIQRSEDTETYLREARTIANLDHPQIVPIYDVGSSIEHPCYIVSKFIEGGRPSQADEEQSVVVVGGRRDHRRCLRPSTLRAQARSGTSSSFAVSRNSTVPILM
jgi:hypothetical protein